MLPLVDMKMKLLDSLPCMQSRRLLERVRLVVKPCACFDTMSIIGIGLLNGSVRSSKSHLRLLHPALLTNPLYPATPGGLIGVRVLCRAIGMRGVRMPRGRPSPPVLFVMLTPGVVGAGILIDLKLYLKSLDDFNLFVIKGSQLVDDLIMTLRVLLLHQKRVLRSQLKHARAASVSAGQ